MTPDPDPSPDAGRPPGGCAVAFKEWLGVCEALGSGRQSLILRKGGVAEDGGEYLNFSNQEAKAVSALPFC